MRRYGSLKYGMTQYGKGTVTVGLVQSVVQFNANYSYRKINKIKYTDNIVFTDRFLPDVLREVWLTDTIIIEDDIRLKYVRMMYASSIIFTTEIERSVVLPVARMTDNIVFSEKYDHVTLLKNTGAWFDITFTEHFFARHNWEPVPNPYDDIWTPRPMETDIWVPRVIPTDIWIPREQNNG